MIASFIAQAREEGLIRLEAPWHFNLQIRLRRCLVDVFDAHGTCLHLRIAETYDLGSEYDVALSASRTHAGVAPRPLGLLRRDSLTCIVFEGLQSECVTAAQIRDASPDQPLMRGLTAFFASQAADVSACAGIGVDAWQEALVRHPWDAGEAPTVNRLLDTATGSFDGVGRECRQHGDLVPANLGLLGQRLVVFDWEDFGRVCVPGFDLAVLLCSSLGFDAEQIRRLRAARSNGAQGPCRGWLTKATAAAGIDLGDFLAALPAYLLLFLMLKHRYSTPIRRRVLASLQVGA